jgi:hemoglobin
MKPLESDIDSREKVEHLVYSFYNQVREDDLIGHVFNSTISDWESHLQNMVSFWSSILLDEGSYRGQPFPKHMKLGIDQRYFDRWLSLFHHTVDTHFQGVNAEEIKKRASTIGAIFSMKIEMLRKEQKG